MSIPESSVNGKCLLPRTSVYDDIYVLQILVLQEYWVLIESRIPPKPVQAMRAKACCTCIGVGTGGGGSRGQAPPPNNFVGGGGPE